MTKGFFVSIRNNFAALQINPVSLRFDKQDNEIAFGLQYYATRKSSIRMFIVLAALFMVSFGPVDVIVYHDTSYLLRLSTIIRYFINTPIIISYIIAELLLPSIYLSYYTATVNLIVGELWILLYIHGNDTVLSYIFPAIVITIIYTLFLLGLRFFVSAIPLLIITITNAVAISLSSTSPALRVNFSFSLLTIAILLVLIAYFIEFRERQLYIMNKRNAALKQAEIDSNRKQIEWLKCLAQFLRHEVRQPIAQLNSIIEIAQTESTLASPINSLLDEAKQSNINIWNLIERACLATDSETFVRQAKSQYVDLVDLILKQVTAFGKTIADAMVEFKCAEPVLRCWCDPVLVGEALGNLLANAGSYAEPQSKIIVSLVNQNRFATMSVRNKGALLTQHYNVLLGPFISTRSGPASEHHGLGLYIVRLVAEHYQGEVAIRNLPDGEGVEATFSMKIY
jgi:signal transduction histidine kinase